MTDLLNIRNDINSRFTVDVFASNYTGGSDDWYSLPPGEQGSWKRQRTGWELVAFRRSGTDGHRAGVYVQIPCVVVFHDFDNIEVKPA